MKDHMPPPKATFSAQILKCNRMTWIWESFASRRGKLRDGSHWELACSTFPLFWSKKSITKTHLLSVGAAQSYPLLWSTGSKHQITRILVKCFLSCWTFFSSLACSTYAYVGLLSGSLTRKVFWHSWKPLNPKPDEPWETKEKQFEKRLVNCCTRLSIEMSWDWWRQRDIDRYKDHLDGQWTKKCPKDNGYILLCFYVISTCVVYINHIRM